MGVGVSMVVVVAGLDPAGVTRLVEVLGRGRQGQGDVGGVRVGVAAWCGLSVNMRAGLLELLVRVLWVGVGMQVGV